MSRETKLDDGPEVAHVGRFFTRANLVASLPFLAIGVLLALAVLVAGRELGRNVEQVQSWIEQLGSWGPLVFIAVMVLGTSLLVPDTVLCLIAGALFGMLRGSLVVVAGNLLAAVLQYALSHRLLRARIRRALASRPSLAAIQRAVAHDEFRMQLLLRLTPLNPATVNYLLGAAGVRFAGFWIASLAHTPNLMLEVYLGHAGKHVVRMAGGNGSADRLHDYAIVVGVVVSVVALVLIAKLARRAVLRAVAESSSVPDETGAETA